MSVLKLNHLCVSESESLFYSQEDMFSERMSFWKVWKPLMEVSLSLKKTFEENIFFKKRKTSFI